MVVAVVIVLILTQWYVIYRDISSGEVRTGVVNQTN